MTNVPRNVLKPPPQKWGGYYKSLMLVTPDPFPSPAHKKEGKGSGPPDYVQVAILAIRLPT